MVNPPSRSSLEVENAVRFARAHRLSGTALKRFAQCVAVTPDADLDDRAVAALILREVGQSDAARADAYGKLEGYVTAVAATMRSTSKTVRELGDAELSQAFNKTGCP